MKNQDCKIKTAKKYYKNKTENEIQRDWRRTTKSNLKNATKNLTLPKIYPKPQIKGAGEAQICVPTGVGQQVFRCTFIYRRHASQVGQVSLLAGGREDAATGESGGKAKER